MSISSILFGSSKHGIQAEIESSRRSCVAKTSSIKVEGEVDVVSLLQSWMFLIWFILDVSDLVFSQRSRRSRFKRGRPFL